MVIKGITALLHGCHVGYSLIDFTKPIVHRVTTSSQLDTIDVFIVCNNTAILTTIDIVAPTLTRTNFVAITQTDVK